MKRASESDEVDGLLDAVLTDDDWQALSSSLKRDALAAIGVAGRRRRWRVWIGQAVCAVGLLIATVWWGLPLTAVRPPMAATAGEPTSSGSVDPFISEAEMLAMFPAGSCVVAEVNGRKELVFFDARQAEEGFVPGGR